MSPNGKPIGSRFDIEEYWTSADQVVEAPRPNLERKPSRSFLRAFGLTLIVGGVVLGAIAVMWSC